VGAPYCRIVSIRSQKDRKLRRKLLQYDRILVNIKLINDIEEQILFPG
jgi:hypothetical protein